MALLPAVVPDIPESRGELVPARIARKVGPLFGVPWPAGPFGSRTWVSDYGRITLSEIARGAPLPTRAQARALVAADGAEWEVRERVAVTSGASTLPREIPNTTLNRFGPDTKAAVVLTAVNRLLAPVTDAVDTALRIVAETGGPSAQLRLAAWAGVVLEVFRSQPALVAAGIRARTIQRELVVSWRLPRAGSIADLPLTRCELGQADTAVQPGANDRPFTLEVADRTIGALHVNPLQGRSDDLATRLLRDETVDLLLRRLLAAGTPHDSSHLWLSEREPGQLAVEALIPPTDIVDGFVDQAARALGVPDRRDGGGLVLPGVPTPDRVRALPLLARRAVLIATLSALRHVQFSPRGRDATRHEVPPLLARIDELARTCLDEDDPVRALARCRVADMTVQTLRHDTGNELGRPVADLREALSHVHRLTRSGVIDRGAAAEAISSANVELNAVRWTNAADPRFRLPDPAELHEELRRSWAAFLDALEIDPSASEHAAAYHLQNYAAFLASPPSNGSAAVEDDLREAVRLFRTAVIPAREAFHRRTGVFRPLRHSLQVATRATTRLAELARDRGDRADAREIATLGLEWIRRALDGAGPAHPLAPGGINETGSRLALLAVPALVVGLELDAPGSEPGDAELAGRFLDAVSGWEDPLGTGTRHARHGEVRALRHRLSALRDPGPSSPA